MTEAKSIKPKEPNQAKESNRSNVGAAVATGTSDALERYRQEAMRSMLGLNVQRATFDVHIADRAELVTLSIRGGTLHAFASDGESDGPFVRRALKLLAGGELLSATSEVEIQAAAASEVKSSGARDESDTMADALDDLITAVVRLGTRAAHGSPSVDEGFSRLLRCVGPVPVGLARWIGQLQAALVRQNTEHIARLLDGASRLVVDMRAGERSTEGRRRVLSWLGGPRLGGPGLGERPAVDGDVEILTERTLVEVGRELVSGTQRAEIERRYLVDAESSEVFCEEVVRGQPGSLGPCPRQLQVGLAEVRYGVRPRRIRVLQYSVSAMVQQSSWERIASGATRDFASLGEDFREALKAFPGLSEPFCLVAPTECERDRGLLPRDEANCALPIAREAGSGYYESLVDFAADSDPTWLAGRLTSVQGTLTLLPFSAARVERPHTLFHRVR